MDGLTNIDGRPYGVKMGLEKGCFCLCDEERERKRERWIVSQCSWAVSTAYQHTNKKLSIIDGWAELLGVAGATIGREAQVGASKLY